MADRALFEAFQKVKDRVEDVVSETRKKEEKARAAEEAKRLAAKKAKAAPAPQPRFVSEEKKNTSRYALERSKTCGQRAREPYQCGRVFAYGWLWLSVG